MWIKRMFGMGESPPQQQEVESSIIIIDTQTDTRYQKLTLPKYPANDLLLQSETVFLYEQSFTARIYPDLTPHFITLIATDRQLLITPNIMQCANPFHANAPYRTTFQLYYGAIDRLLKKDALEIYLKDARAIILHGPSLHRLHQLIQVFGLPKGVNRLFAFRYGMHRGIQSYVPYDIQGEFMRQFAQYKSFFRKVDNSAGSICMTYPLQIVVPDNITDKELMRCSKFRTRERIPTVTYFHQWEDDEYVVLGRCSQIKSGIMSNRCSEDEMMIASLAHCAERCGRVIKREKHSLQYYQEDKEDMSVLEPALTYKHKIKIFDARGYYAALGNKLAGKGFQKPQTYNCQVQFLNIPNIHAVRQSFIRVKSTYNQDPLLSLMQSNWIQYTSLILQGATMIANTLESGTSALIHCSDGWDRTTQLSALTQLLLDPFFRSLRGFSILLEKQFCGFGHKFRERIGHPSEYLPQEQSPIFVQFLDCVFQVMQQHPTAFEFNTHLLVFLAEQAYSHTYGNFICNSVQEALQLNLNGKTVSVWEDVRLRQDLFTNVFYRQGEQVITVLSSQKQLLFWKEYFLGYTYEQYQQVGKQYDQINVQMNSSKEETLDSISKIKCIYQ